MKAITHRNGNRNRNGEVRKKSVKKSDGETAKFVCQEDDPELVKSCDGVRDRSQYMVQLRNTEN